MPGMLDQLFGWGSVVTSELGTVQFTGEQLSSGITLRGGRAGVQSVPLPVVGLAAGAVFRVFAVHASVSATNKIVVSGPVPSVELTGPGQSAALLWDGYAWRVVAGAGLSGGVDGALALPWTVPIGLDVAGTYVWSSAVRGDYFKARPNAPVYDQWDIPDNGALAYAYKGAMRGMGPGDSVRADMMPRYASRGISEPVEVIHLVSVATWSGPDPDVHTFSVLPDIAYLRPNFSAAIRWRAMVSPKESQALSPRPELLSGELLYSSSAYSTTGLATGGVSRIAWDVDVDPVATIDWARTATVGEITATLSRAVVGSNCEVLVELEATISRGWGFAPTGT